MFLLSARAVFRFEIDQHLTIAVKFVQKPDTGRGQLVMFTQVTISIPLNCLNIAKTGDPELLPFSLLLIMWACNKPIKPIDTDEGQHIILSKKLVNCTPSADCDQALISYMLQSKSHYSSFSRYRVRWVKDGECSEFSNCSDLSRKKTGCAFHLIHNKSVHWKLRKLKEKFWSEISRAQGFVINVTGLKLEILLSRSVAQFLLLQYNLF